MKFLTIILVFGVYSKFGAKCESSDVSQNEEEKESTSIEKRSAGWSEKDVVGFNNIRVGRPPYFDKSSMNILDEVPDNNDSDAEENDIVNDINGLQRDQIPSIKDVMEMADFYGYNLPQVISEESHMQTVDDDSENPWLINGINAQASDIRDSYEMDDLSSSEEEQGSVDKRGRPYNILDDYNFKRAPGWAVTYGKRAPGWAAVYGKRAPGWAATYGKRSQGWSALYGKRAPGWAAVYGKRAPGWAAVYGKRAPGWAAVYGKRAPGWAAVYGKRAPGWAAVYGKRSQGWSALYGKRAPGWTATYGKRMPGWTPTYGKRSQGWSALYGKRAPGWAAVYGKRNSDSQDTDDVSTENIDSSKRSQAWAALYGR